MTLLMAKRKKPERARDAVTFVRSFPEWKGWVDELAEFDRAPTVSDLIDRALVAYARDRGFPKLPPKR